jgi:hypothetical protein
MLSTALTSFVGTPLADQVSMALMTFFGGVAGSGFLSSSSGPYRHLTTIFLSDSTHIPAEEDLGNQIKHDLYAISSHPQGVFGADFEEQWLLSNARVVSNGDTKVSVTPLFLNSHSESKGMHIFLLPLCKFVASLT